MNEIFAVDPQAPQDHKDIKAMFKQFGFEHGRFIAIFPDDWIRLFCEHSHHLKDVEKQRFMRLLSLNKDALIDVSLGYMRSRSWIENASNVKDTSKTINRILATDPNKLGVETLNNFLWIADEENKSRGAHISMSAEAYQKAIRPLVHHSTEVHLVDPFFQLRHSKDGQIHRGRQLVLRHFFIEAENSKRCEIFKIHFKREPHLSKVNQEKQIEDDLSEVCMQANLLKLNIQFTLNGEMSHGRYFFSIKGGLQFDHGFEPLRDKTNHVHWLSKAELDPIHKRYL